MVPLNNRISFLFAEKGYLELDGNAVVLRQGDDLVHFPVGTTSVIFIEPGTVVTHAAVKACAESGCLLIWVGEAGVRVYAAGIHGGSAHEKIIQQAKINLDGNLRLQAAKRVYSLMFSEEPPKCRSVEQLRGMEGYRVKQRYKELATENNIEWKGRDQKNALADPLNRAISAANAALYGVTEAVILSLGYTPSIGLVHSGNRRSFVFDIADTVKFKSVVPMAIKLYAENKIKTESDVRTACRDVFREMSLIHAIVSNIDYVMAA